MHLFQGFIYTAGIYLTFAFDDLSFKAVASQFPISPGPYDIYKASNALDRKTYTCMRTDVIGTNTPHKTTWWKIDLGGVYSIFSINILMKNYESFEYRQRGRFAGFSLYVSNTGNIEGSTLCYKDGPQLPPLNFTTTCTEYGRYVIFYNERKDGVVYPEEYQLSTVFTELCEVIVKGCKQSGVYGIACDFPCPLGCKGSTCHIQSGTCFECEHGVYGGYCNVSCPTNCKNNTCQVQNGTCFTCSPGWTGIYCETRCTEGWYGISCSQQCTGHCRDGVTCNQVTGHCDRGCDAGWTGFLCIKECGDGTYGYDCVNNCSGHCLNNSPCNKQTGHCDGGCNPGYTDAYCRKKCEGSHFGLDCKELCSGHCENNDPCDHVSGVCPGGCQDGYMDEYCNNSCKIGNYGKNCSLPCPPSCIGTCRHIDGSYEDCEESLKSHCPKESMILNQNVSSSNSWSTGLIVSLVINFVLISVVCLLCRGIYTKKVSISSDLLPCSKKSIYYTDTTVKAGENSTYQELDLSGEEMQYQNTTIR